MPGQDLHSLAAGTGMVQCLSRAPHPRVYYSGERAAACARWRDCRKRGGSDGRENRNMVVAGRAGAGCGRGARRLCRGAGGARSRRSGRAAPARAGVCRSSPPGARNGVDSGRMDLAGEMDLGGRVLDPSAPVLPVLVSRILVAPRRPVVPETGTLALEKPPGDRALRCRPPAPVPVRDPVPRRRGGRGSRETGGWSGTGTPVWA